jgi:pimeloyl-ACP methyl ester carboxylesterase
MQARLVPIRDAMFQAEVFEAGSGSPLLFLHSEFGLEPGDFLAALAAHYRVIAPRHPGFGESTGTERLLDLHDLLYYYLDFLDTMQLRQLPVVGHGLGGMFAAELAALQPERFTKLVLIAPYGVWNAEDPSYDIFATTPRELVEHLFYNAKTPAAVAIAEAPSEQERLITFMVERAKSMATSAKYLWPIPNRGLRNRAHRISAPTLIVWGQEDKIIPPSYAEEFKRLIPNATVATIPNAGHLPDVEQPARLAEEVLSFLGR